ncbi:IS701 family transposase [Crocosphaera watsonii WH 8501]|uniref:IS701 family transposase n=1 Tax=Crocosphaera watsonii TaxID=263511 RepID=UPI0009030D11|nr:transposase [Crocosphaera watsonii]
MRLRSKPSTAQCNLDQYTYFLLSEPKYTGCCRLAEILEISRHSTNRFLLREQYEPIDLFREVQGNLNLIGGVLSGDDTVIEKHYSQVGKAHLINYYWSGKHQKAIKGINLITLYYTDYDGKSMPINYRLYDPLDNKTKNDYLREMIVEVIKWGVKPSTITTDCWYSSKENLRFFRDKELNFQVGIAKNRQVKVEGGKYQRVEELEIPNNGLIVIIKKFGKVKIFKRTFKHGSCRYYATFLYDESKLMDWKRDDFRELQTIHWGIECYHRALKQLCGLSKFQVRTTKAIVTHIFCSLRAFCQLELMRIKATIESWYSLQRELSLKVAREFILEQLSPTNSLTA